MHTSPITVQATVKAPLEKVWNFWTQPEHIVNWAFASDDWHAPEAENDVRVGGKFKTVMAARDKSTSFDFEGEYTDVQEHAVIKYIMSDGRQVKIEFSEDDEGTKVVQTFDPEVENDIKTQRDGWQAILDNFKKYVESK